MMQKFSAGLQAMINQKQDEIKQQDDVKQADEKKLKRKQTMSEKREQARLERLKKREKGCGKLIWGIKMFLKLKAGIMFFQYVQTPLDGDMNDDEPIDDDDEIDEAEKLEEKKACSYQKATKNIITALLFIGVFFGVVKDYIDLIGKEKSQKLSYFDKTNLTYDITDIPGKLPAHHFTFFQKQEVTDRMKCKLYDNEQECLKIEEERCELKGLTTAAYEDCMISLNILLGNNATQFCVDHYTNMDLWVNTLSPKYVLYHQRKHSCYESSGVPKGKEFCDDMKKYNQGWSIQNLFNCYRSNGVDFSQQYCEDKFDVKLSPTSKTEQNFLRCLADRGIKKGKPFCQLNNKGDSKVKVEQRIECYDSIPLITKDVCDEKQNHKAAVSKMGNGGNYNIKDITSQDWDVSSTQECYRGLGVGDLNEEFCKSYHVYEKDTNRTLMTENLYECYRLIGIPKNTDEDKREKCELSYLQKMEDKYHCIRGEGLIEMGDFCYLTYFWEDQYPDLYNCLTNDTHSDNKYIDIDSTFCEKQFNYKLKKWKKESSPYSYQAYTNQLDVLYQEKVQCQDVNGSFPEPGWNLGDTTNQGRECKDIMTMKDFTNHDFDYYIPIPKEISWSKGAKQDPVTLKECFLMEGQQSSEKPTFTVKYENMEQVHAVNIYNLQQGSKASLLAQASIYVMNQTSQEKTLCAKISKLPAVDETLNLDCEQDETAPWKLLGDQIMIESNVPGTMTVCDFKMIANIEANEDLIQTQTDKHKECADYINQCDTVFTDNQGPNIENYYNCRNRYGRPITAQFCIDQHASNTAADSKFAYPLTNKYKCLMNNREIIGKVNVTTEVTGCMNLFYDYLMENCLTNYEASFEPDVIGFNQKVNSTELDYRSYGNKTISIADRIRHEQEEKARIEAAQIAAQAVQVPIVTFEEDLSPEAIRDYLCSKTDMWFYSNSYNDADINPGRVQDAIVLNMTCDIFEFYDPVLDEQQIGVHFYLVEDLIFRQPLKNGSAEGAFFFINRTELNQQYFQLEIQRELEFLTVRKNQMYLREQIPGEEELDVPLVKTETEYNNFRSEVQSLKIYESQDFKIALEEHESTILDASSQVNTYEGVPDPKREMKVKLKVLEIDLAFTTIVDEIIVVEPENNIRMMVELDKEQQKQEIFTTQVGFRFSFTEKKFDYKYYSANDVIIELGGINGIVGPLLASFTQYFIILFIVDLVRKIRRKSKRDQKQFTRVTLGPRLPEYKQCIEKLIEMGPESDASSVLGDDESKEIGDLLGKDNDKDSLRKSAKKEGEQEGDSPQKEGGEAGKEFDKLELPQMKKSKSNQEIKKVNLRFDEKMSAVQKKAELRDHLEMVEELIKHLDPEKDEDDEENEEIPEDEMTEEQLAEKQRKKEEEEKLQEELRAEEERERLEDEEARKSGLKVKKRKRKEYTKMSKLVQLEHQYTTLVLMEKTYGKFMKEFDIRNQIGEIFDDYEEVDKYLQERRQITFLKVVELFKKRLSFFGIYSLNDQIELTNQKAVYLRKQLSVVVKLLLQFQDKLINDIETERKQTVEFINERFSQLTEQANAQEEAPNSARNLGDQIQAQFDGDLKKIHDEVQNIKQEIMSGALQDKMSDVLTKKSQVFTGNLKNEIIFANRLIFESDIFNSIKEYYEKIEANINDGKHELVFRDIKSVLTLMKDFAEQNSQNVQKVLIVVQKVDFNHKDSFDLLFRTIDDTYISWGEIQENFGILRGLQDAVWQAFMDHGEINTRQRAQMENEKNNWFEIEQLNDQVNKDMAILMKEAKVTYEKILSTKSNSNEESKKNQNKN